jgi:hypothetical protein
VSHRRSALEAILTDCGWKRDNKVWRLEKFCIPQKTIDKLTAHGDGTKELAGILEFAATNSGVKHTIEILTRGLSTVHN